MTVQLSTETLVYCLWFAGTELRTNAFDAQMLEPTTCRADENAPDVQGDL